MTNYSPKTSHFVLKMHLSLIFHNKNHIIDMWFKSTKSLPYSIYKKKKIQFENHNN